MIWHNATVDEVIEELETDSANGLNEKTAKKRLDEYGKNLSVCEEEMSLGAAVIKQLKKPTAIVLFSLLIIYILRELVTARHDFLLPIVLFVILVIKEACCTYAEYTSRNMLASLKNRIHTSARVIRNGKVSLIKADYLVPGDVILLHDGDYIPADARIIESFALRCDESVLQGEKEVIVVQKSAEAMHEDHTKVTERSNMVYCGCLVISGTARAIVTETGEEAEIRKNIKRDKVFFKKGIQERIADRFDGFYKIFRITVMVVCALLTLIGTFATGSEHGWGKFLEALIAAVCFYIAIVPSSFPTRIASLFSLGIKRIDKDKAFVFNPSTVEKLSSVSVICADKTGTLTQNRMSLVKVYDGDEVIDLTSHKITKQCEVAMRFAALSCDIKNHEVSDHTEAALVSSASRYLNIFKTDFDAEFPRLASIPLTPERKMKTTVNMIDGKAFAIVRGNPDKIIERSIDVDADRVYKAYEEMAKEGLRVLAIAYKVFNEIPSDNSSENLESGLTFLGLFGILDRERKGIQGDIKMCRRAGISTVMFTGDHINTATTIAEKIGILQKDEIAVTGEQIDTLTDEELEAVVDKIKVCAQTSSEQRVRLVKALRANGENVLITADSAANYAPMAIADVGCAMGKSGKDVAKGNADLLIYDDSFSTIVKSIRNARGIFGNFTKYINYYVTMCACLFISVLVNTLVFKSFVPTSAFILITSIFALIFPILSIGFETADISIMKSSPRTVGEQLFDLKTLLINAGIGAASAIPSIIVGVVNRADGKGPASVCLSLCMSLIYIMFAVRSSEFFYKRLTQNHFLIACSILSAFLTVIITVTPVSRIFGLIPTGGVGFVTSLILPLIIPISLEIVKLVFFIKAKKN